MDSCYAAKKGIFLIHYYLYIHYKETFHEKTNRGYARVDRIKEQIMRELAELVRTGLKRPARRFYHY